MNSFSENALILVAVMPNIKDFEIARLLGWYRIPLRMAPKIIDVDYLAFYQTGSFGYEHRWKIEYFAEVMGHELTTRGALLKDEANHPRANEEYFKIQIGPIEKLSPPIPAGEWKRITFLYTLGSLVNEARIVNDLVVKANDREVLWKCLRERKQAYHPAEENKQLKLLSDDELLQLLGQMISPMTEEDFTII
ncbi:MAG: hypothetical protein CVU42_14130 [Chloroflexi bacterium HGW-Chloroflexi-4]|jgi:hypothetical protein|nr:MAG: hypothetical protein CVU42_14130 [Chloroflexi bacterium HGW-Chloroflexi-4]